MPGLIDQIRDQSDPALSAMWRDAEQVLRDGADPARQD
jgi:hypothetical protein